MTVRMVINTSMYGTNALLLEALLFLSCEEWLGIGPRCVVGVSFAVSSSSSLFLLPVCGSCIGRGSYIVVVEVVVTGGGNV